ncbi:hypothetical protein GC209_01990 [bacterium]|nr:hypothetical protein [bacterium]
MTLTAGGSAQDRAQRASSSMPPTALCAEFHRMVAAAGLGGEGQAALVEYLTGPKKENFR